MLFLILAQAALAQNPLAVTHPKGDRRPLFSSNDYPAEAARHGWSGSVVADLTIDWRGRVSKCKIVQTSGHAILDTKTCEILVQRAKFYPARDRDRKPVEDVVRTPPINWSPN
jgi:TonB family protein